MNFLRNSNFVVYHVQNKHYILALIIWYNKLIKFLLAIIPVIGLTISVSYPIQTALAQNVTGTASVIDGDTLEIHGQRIRLQGIDAPESGQNCKTNGKSYRCGQQAAFALSDKIGQATVSCQSTGIDRYGRIIAKCFKGHEDLNAWMVSQGWAISYRQYSMDYVPNEKVAKASKKGIWSGQFVVPSQWRRGSRLDDPSIVPTDGSCQIKGNISSKGEKIFHIPGGRWYKNTKINITKGERMFCSEQEAISAGWRKSSQ